MAKKGVLSNKTTMDLTQDSDSDDGVGSMFETTLQSRKKEEEAKVKEFLKKQEKKMVAQEAETDEDEVEAEKTVVRKQASGKLKRRRSPTTTEDEDEEAEEELVQQKPLKRRPTPVSEDEEVEEATLKKTAALIRQQAIHGGQLPGKDKFKAGKAQREAEEYQKLIDSKLDPSPKAITVYARDESSMEVAQQMLEKQPLNDLAIWIGDGNRPIYIIFLKGKAGQGHHPYIALLNTGEGGDDILRELGFQEDNWQPNRQGRGGPSLSFPYYSQSKAQLSFDDLEVLRYKGKALLRRARDLAAMGPGQRGEVYTLDTEDSEDSYSARVKLFMDEQGKVLVQFSKVGRSVVGSPVVLSGSQFTINPKEFKKILYWTEALYAEGFRLASTRQSVPQVLSKELEEGFENVLMHYLVDKVLKAGVEMEGDPEILFDVVAKAVRTKNSGQLKKELNPTKGNKDVFHAYHLKACSSAYLGHLCERLVLVVKSGKYLEEEDHQQE